MKKAVLALAMLGLLVLSCKNNTKKQEDTPEVEKTTDKNVTPDMHTSQISLDWEGVYMGTLPCASCEGIKTRISLKADGSYVLEEEYLGEEDVVFKENGKFEWNADGNTITLHKGSGEKQLFKVVENAIILLSSDGEINTEELADFYKLSKQ
ncbi:copper resistance protein NlpE [Arenibacter latericius]|uniref:copper resistance protein NlpE n=1 Tax=Arenibacter latericius TaxID=86104 RepID=UPI0003F76BF6|nr:copper resistance protein NlpE [Arenibacter latericius]MDX1362995.1 copper resistance protein NlpE [Arenibacter latericius]